MDHNIEIEKREATNARHPNRLSRTVLGNDTCMTVVAEMPASQRLTTFCSRSVSRTGQHTATEVGAPVDAATVILTQGVFFPPSLSEDVAMLNRFARS